MSNAENYPWIDRSIYPFSTSFLATTGGRINYVDEGQGRPVVMLHGNPTWSFLYRRLIEHLRPKYRCIAPDYLGFGLSDKPGGWSYHPEDHARNLERLIRQLDLEDIVLVVQDWGGPIGLSYALNYPQNVRGLIVLNSWMWPLDESPYYTAASYLMGGAAGRFLGRRLNVFPRFMIPALFGDRSKLTPHVHEHYLKPLEKSGERRGTWVFPGQILGATSWLQELWDRRGLLREQPVLIVWGMADIAFRDRELRRWTDLLREAEVVRLEGVGHFVQEEAPGRLNEAAEQFLDGLSREG